MSSLIKKVIFYNKKVILNDKKVIFLQQEGDFYKKVVGLQAPEVEAAGQEFEVSLRKLPNSTSDPLNVDNLH